MLTLSKSKKSHAIPKEIDIQLFGTDITKERAYKIFLEHQEEFDSAVTGNVYLAILKNGECKNLTPPIELGNYIATNKLAASVTKKRSIGT